MNDVQELQHLLNIHGFTDVNGYVLAEDGIVSYRTLQACDKCTIMIGAKGDITKWIQYNLISKGYNLASYGYDGVFGAITYSAIKKFQICNGIKVDGIVGPETWRALLGVINYCIAALQHYLNENGFTDSSGNKLIEDGILSENTFQACNRCTVMMGNKGDIIKWIQTRLVCKGYLHPYEVTGSFNTITFRAVKYLQKDNLLTADGIVGPTTWRLLLK
jgi:peptidoglycan hydrolase-like protein with peptidoglycan-binding domain